MAQATVNQSSLTIGTEAHASMYCFFMVNMASNMDRGCVHRTTKIDNIVQHGVNLDMMVNRHSVWAQNKRLRTVVDLPT